MALMYIHTVGTAFLNLLYILAVGRATFTVIFTTLEDTGVVGKSECKTGSLIESNTCEQ